MDSTKHQASKLVPTRTDGDVPKHLEHIIKQAGKFLIENASILANDGSISSCKGFEITLSAKVDDDAVTINRKSDFYLMNTEEK